MNFLSDQGRQTLDFNQEFNLGALEYVVDAAYTSPDPAMQQAAINILNEFKNHPLSINRADQIIASARSPNAKYIGLQILEGTIKKNWKDLAVNQRNAIRNFLVETIVQKAQDEQALEKEKTFTDKLNATLVEILKLDWPDNWPNFIPELCESSKTSESLCQNNMELLRLFSEEIFDYSKAHITQAKTEYLKDNLTSQFGPVFELCMVILENSTNLKLILSTLATLERFVHWIPSGYIFETSFCSLLLDKFFINGHTQCLTARCLAEIACAPAFEAKYNYHLVLLLKNVLDKLKAILPLSLDIVSIYKTSPDTAKNFIKAIAIFLSEFLLKYLPLLEQNVTHTETLLDAHRYLLFMTEVDDNDVFRICLEYWTKLCSDLKASNSYDINMSPRTTLYNTQVLSRLRVLMIPKMVKPEEVLVIETESGEVVRETMPPHTEVLNQYKTMKETLINLTLLDHIDTPKILNEKLQSQYTEFDTNRKYLNCVCWAIGSISGALSAEDEKSFLVTVIRFLLWLVEKKKGKDNKAAIAANIMYIVGQYPRFLKAHWNFLKTVINKLFEFMHETHEGVQDMACDTFIKIAKSCKNSFVVNRDTSGTPISASQSMARLNPSGHSPSVSSFTDGVCFVDEILDGASITVRDLDPNQTNVFFEAVAIMISAEDLEAKRNMLIEKCMFYPNQNFDNTISLVKRDISILEDKATLQSLISTIRTNTQVATALGSSYSIQLRKIYSDLLSLYSCTSTMINTAISSLGELAAKNHTIVKSMRGVKKEALSLLKAWMSTATDVNEIIMSYLDPLLDTVLVDYRTNIPQAREAEVLSLMCVVVERLEHAVPAQIIRIFSEVFECTLDMINKDLSMYPYHRTYFFQLIQAINKHSFEMLFSIPPAQFDLVIEAMIWAMKHEIGSITAIGLETLVALLQNMSMTSSAQNFYSAYYVKILDQLFGIITDPTHNSEFKLQTQALSILIQLVVSNHVAVPLYADNAYPSNTEFIKNHLNTAILVTFPNLKPLQVENIINKLFLLYANEGAFEQCLVDFLIQIKTVCDENDINLELKSTQTIAQQFVG